MTQQDSQLVETWLQQEPPKAETLTREDLHSADIALDVLNRYRQASKYLPFELDRTMIGEEVGMAHQDWDATLQRARRGVAILNGYLLVYNARVPSWQEAPEHPEAIVSGLIFAGYTAMQEYHRTLSLVEANDLITISAAATILFGDNSQAHRVRIAEYLDEGYVQEFRDRTEANPQKSRRVSTRQIIKLKMQRQDR